MKHTVLTKAAGLVVCAALAASLAGCGAASSAPASESAASSTAPVTAGFGPAANFDYESFTYSQGLTDTGFFEGITALDYVTLPEGYATIAISTDKVTPTDAEIQQQVEDILASYATTEAVTGRAAQSGDTANIDYAGSVNGVAFTGGTSTGFDLVLGSGSFIDGFKDQVIGHTTGETFDVNVTFPEGYRDSTDEAGNVIVLSGTPAVFRVTLNSISASVTPELTDAWVSATFGESEGMHTVADLEDTLRSEQFKANKQDAVLDYLLDNSTFGEIPAAVLNYEVCQCLAYYNNYASYYSVDLETFIQQQVGYDTTDALLADYETTLMGYCREALVYQAVAEAMGLTLDDNTLEAYADYVSTYGDGYVAMYAMNQEVLNTLADSAYMS